MLKKIQDSTFKVIELVASKMGSNQTLTAISQGFMKIMPITLGLILFSIIGNLPIPAFTEWLAQIGVKDSIDAALSVSSNLVALYLSFSLSYCFASNRNQSAITVGFISMASFVLLMPMMVGVGENAVPGISFEYTGSSAIIIALISSIVVAQLYCFLAERGIKIKLPKSVPSMVSESLEPIFISMTVFALIVLVRVFVSFTEFGTVHALINQVIGAPLMKIGTSIPALLFVLFLSNVFWFFGIHPTTIQGPLSAVLFTMVLDNIDKFQAGEPMLYVVPVLTYLIAGMGANGNTIGLIISMFSAKSNRYKAMLKLSLVPHIFNINEPLIFGMPVILNPIFFLPMTFGSVITGTMVWLSLQIIPITYNPLMDMLPWTTPIFIKYFFVGGINLFLIVGVLIIVNTLIYYPFFKIADKEALKEEIALSSNSEK